MKLERLNSHRKVSHVRSKLNEQLPVGLSGRISRFRPDSNRSSKRPLVEIENFRALQSDLLVEASSFLTVEFSSHLGALT